MATAVSSPVAVLHANDDVAEKKKRRQSLVDERKRRKSIMPDTQSPMKKAVASTQQVQVLCLVDLPHSGLCPD